MAAAPRRVAVFFDYQNIWGGARDAFYEKTDPVQNGQFRPRVLADLLARKVQGRNDVTFVGIYCGLPDSTRDRKTFAARRRQMAAWEKAGVTVRARALRYPRDWPRTDAEEKGVDVALALDAVMGAVNKLYDAAIIASVDSDLAPVVEAILELQRQNGSPAVEVIAFKGLSKRIGVSGQQLTERWISRLDWNAVADPTDYNLAPA